jgi:predicted peroxiredoxin
MKPLLYVLTHSTEAPDRAVTGLHAALAAVRAGHDVALWLTGEGVRLGIEGVAETLAENVPESAARMVAALQEGGCALHLDRYSFARRKYEEAAVLDGAHVSEAAVLASLLANRAAVTL